MKNMIDLRSDTVTQPTEAMRRAMCDAPVGDDVYGEDPTVKRLEEMSARLMGKEAAMFVPSGTMANELAIMTHTTPGDEIIAGARSHVIIHEVGAPARLAGVGYALVDNPDNIIRPDDVRARIRPDDLMSPPTTLLCLENALTDGNVVSVEDLDAAFRAGKDGKLAVHLDGARIFNAAVALGVEAAAIAATGDSVMFCLSKGLCAPVGSVLCGTRACIARAKKFRKMIGGGMRQAGILAAAGVYALEHMVERLGEDHENARKLGALLAEIPGIRVKNARLRINMLFFSIDRPGADEAAFVAFLLTKGIKANGQEFPGEYRFVTHHGVGVADIDHVAQAVRQYVSGLPRA